jgi:tetratricopeptide (TPR) repeat protein
MMQFALESAAAAEKNPRIKRLPGIVYWDMGRTAKSEGKTEQAIDLYEKALTFGESYLVLEYLADAFRDARMPDKALEAINRAITLLPNAPDAYARRSKIFFSQEKWGEALEDLEKMKLFGGKDNDELIETRGWEGRQILSQGHSLYRLQSLTQAIEKYNLALRFDPENAEAYCWRGRAFHRTGNDRAEDDLRKAVSINPHLFDAYQGLDDVLLKRRRLDEIIELWNRYIELEPGVAQAYLERGGTYYNKKDFDSAYRDAKRACDLGNKDACTRMQALKDGPLRDKVAEIDREIAAGSIGSAIPKANGIPEKIKTPGGKWSFRDSQGKLITTEQFDDAWDFKDGYARVRKNGKWGYLDVKGNFAIKPQYDYCWDFSGDKAKVRMEDGSTHYINHIGKQLTE